jgi:antitoxin CptB
MSNERIDNKRKRLIFRSWHRGTKEMDLLLGSFANRHVPEFSEDELVMYDELLHHSDPDLYNWITGREEVPANFVNPVIEKFLAHKFSE